MRKFLVGIIAISILLPLSVSAHPGNTDSAGCHTCRTNCTEKWGLAYGEYHCHNGGSGGGGSSNSYQAAPIVDHYKIGYDEGYGAGYSASTSTATNIPSGNKDFQSGYKQGFSDGYYQQQAEYSDGKIAGYEHKRNNKNVLYTDPENCAAAYINGYRTGFNNADAEIKSEVETLVKSATKADIDNAIYNPVIAEELSNYQGHFEKLYESQYQDLLDGYLKQVNQLGSEQGRSDALAQLEYNNAFHHPSFPKLDAITTAYQVAYAEGYASGEAERITMFFMMVLAIMLIVGAGAGIFLYVRSKKKKQV